MKWSKIQINPLGREIMEKRGSFHSIEIEITVQFSSFTVSTIFLLAKKQYSTLRFKVYFEIENIVLYHITSHIDASIHFFLEVKIAT